MDFYRMDNWMFVFSEAVNRNIAFQLGISIRVAACIAQPAFYVLAKCKQLKFLCVCAQGYSFMAPSILFKRNVVMDDPVQLCGGSERPGSAAVARSAMMKVRWMGLDPSAQTHLH